MILLRRRRARDGATALEFGLVLPLFVMLSLGVLDTGWLFWQNAAMQVAISDGCRAGSILDAGQGRVMMSEVVRGTETAVLDRLSALGVACRDCAVQIDATEVDGVLSLECTMERTAQSLAGVYAGLQLESVMLAQMEVQR